jgi:hypothetical protein
VLDRRRGVNLVFASLAAAALGSPWAKDAFA